MIATAVCHAMLLGRLWFMGLASRYRFLAAWLALEAIEGAGLALIPIRSYAYTYTYMGVVPILWILAYLVVLELCRLILEDYPGIAGAGRRIVNWTMGATLIVSAVVAVWGLMARTGRYPFMRSFAIIHLSVRAGLLVFLLVILLFVIRLRLRLPRNRIIYGIGFAACWAMGVVADGLSRIVSVDHAEMIYCIEMLLCSVLLIAGAFLLTPSGENRNRIGEPDPDERRADIHRHLARMNDLLLKARPGETDSHY
jgi:hypothetical protein